MCVAVGAVCTWGGFLQDVPAVEGSLLLLAQVGAVLQQPVGDPALTNAWKEAQHPITTGVTPTRANVHTFTQRMKKEPSALILQHPVLPLSVVAAMSPDLLRAPVCVLCKKMFKEPAGESKCKSRGLSETGMKSVKLLSDRVIFTEHDAICF